MQNKIELYDYQKEVVQLLEKRKHVFAFLPTGAGKSLCYQVPALEWGWRVLVVSPLVALMEDQVASAQSMGISSARLHSSLPDETRQSEWRRIFHGDASLVFVSPERFVQWSGESAKRELLQSFQLLALDELHCAFDWKEFREAYVNLANPIREFAAQGTVLGLSGSLPAVLAKDFFARSGIQVETVIRSLGRHNLQQFVIDLENEGEQSLLLVALLRDVKAPNNAIVYCPTRKKAEETKLFLEAAGLSVDLFHAGIPSLTRMQRVKDFREGRLRIVCASNAFGMGIDYPHVDRVIHFGMPYDINTYWQGIGRAGRSGKPALGFVLWCRSDALRIRRMSQEAQMRARDLWTIFLEETCRKISLAKYFGLPQDPCGACDVCWRQQKFSLPDFFPDPYFWLYRRQWWLKNRADTERWLDEYFLSQRKNLDESVAHDNVSTLTATENFFSDSS